MLLVFISLQLLDAITTVLFLRHGVTEGNPLIRALFGLPAGPVAGLALAKLGGAALAILAWRTGRQRLLARVNMLFAGCVLWNITSAIGA